ncbi:MAG: AraC-like DNA-binding protein [Rhodothermales bacterium]
MPARLKSLIASRPTDSARRLILALKPVCQFDVRDEGNPPGLERLLSYDVLLTDGSDGFEMVTTVRSTEGRLVPVSIFLSSRDSAASELASREAGVDAVLPMSIRVDALLAALRGLLALRDRVATDEQQSPNRALAASAEKCVLANLYDPDFRVGRLASELNMSYSQLARRLNKNEAENPTRLIRRVRISCAADLLQEKSRKVSDVAFAVGFRSVSHFNRAFREVMGRSPSAFRKGAMG